MFVLSQHARRGVPRVGGGRLDGPLQQQLARGAAAGAVLLPAQSHDPIRNRCDARWVSNQSVRDRVSMGCLAPGLNKAH